MDIFQVNGLQIKFKIIFNFFHIVLNGLPKYLIKMLSLKKFKFLNVLRRELDSFGGYFSVKGNEKHFAIQIYMETIVEQ